MAKICLVVLIGLPAAGKTSFADGFKEFLAGSSVNLLHICFDKLVSIDQRIIDENLFKITREKCIKQVEEKVNSITLKKLKTPTFILIDDNNYYRSMRYQFFQIAKKFNTSFAQIYLKVDVETAILKDLGRDEPVGEEIIRKMALRFESPALSLKWERRSLTISSFKSYNFSEILSFLEEALNFPEIQVKISENLPIPQSEIHQIDLILRKIVGKLSKNEKSKGGLFNERRKMLLEDIRNKILPLDLSANAFEKLLEQ